MKHRSGSLLCLTVVAAVLAMSAPQAARADMMSACQSDIASLCSGVSDGRGRISACLFSQSSRLDATCKSEVEAVAKQDQSSELLPAHVRNHMGSGSVPAVPAACSADEGRFCSGADAGDRNMLACLYAHSESVSGGCSSAIQAALE
jgi:hypothetical protein